MKGIKRVIVLFCLLLTCGFGLQSAQAATGKCTVVKVDGGKMVIECDKQTKGFSQGTPIKIKTDKKRTSQGNSP